MSAARLSIKTRVVTLRRTPHRVEFRVLDYYANILEQGAETTFTAARTTGGERAALWRAKLKAEQEAQKIPVGAHNGLL